jgi:hypothetical protein
VVGASQAPAAGPIIGIHRACFPGFFAVLACIVFLLCNLSTMRYRRPNRQLPCVPQRSSGRLRMSRMRIVTRRPALSTTGRGRCDRPGEGPSERVMAAGARVVVLRAATTGLDASRGIGLSRLVVWDPSGTIALAERFTAGFTRDPLLLPILQLSIGWVIHAQRVSAASAGLREHWYSAGASRSSQLMSSRSHPSPISGAVFRRCPRP